MEELTLLNYLKRQPIEIPEDLLTRFNEFLCPNDLNDDYIKVELDLTTDESKQDQWRYGLVFHTVDDLNQFLERQKDESLEHVGIYEYSIYLNVLFVFLKKQFKLIQWVEVVREAVDKPPLGIFLIGFNVKKLMKKKKQGKLIYFQVSQQLKQSESETQRTQIKQTICQKSKSSDIRSYFKEKSQKSQFKKLSRVIEDQSSEIKYSPKKKKRTKLNKQSLNQERTESLENLSFQNVLTSSNISLHQVKLLIKDSTDLIQLSQAYNNSLQQKQSEIQVMNDNYGYILKQLNIEPYIQLKFI